MSIGSLRVMAKVSKPNMVTSEEARTIIDTLGPATNRQVYSSLKQVPVTVLSTPCSGYPGKCRRGTGSNFGGNPQWLFSRTLFCAEGYPGQTDLSPNRSGRLWERIDFSMG